MGCFNSSSIRKVHLLRWALTTITLWKPRRPNQDFCNQDLKKMLVFEIIGNEKQISLILLFSLMNSDLILKISVITDALWILVFMSFLWRCRNPWKHGAILNQTVSTQINFHVFFSLNIIEFFSEIIKYIFRFINNQ